MKFSHSAIIKKISRLRIKKEITKRDRTKYCAFHRDIGHNIVDSFNLKEAIEALIKKGKLQKYRVDNADQNERNNKPEKSYNEISIIVGGPDIGGNSHRA